MKQFNDQVNGSPRLDHPDLTDVIGPTLSGLKMNSRKI